MQKEMPGDRAAENVIFAVVAGPLGRCNTFLRFLYVLPTPFVYMSNFTHSDRVALRAVVVVILWPLLFYKYRLRGSM